eukprot:m.566886 g.566886  ORF g.566886 m.566886 type:complete len:55 (-) comp22254_c0_seq14:554-718(-)
MNHPIPGGKTCDFYGDSLTKAQQNFVIQIKQVCHWTTAGTGPIGRWVDTACLDG